jgi:hypothetical protein
MPLQLTTFTECGLAVGTSIFWNRARKKRVAQPRNIFWAAVADLPINIAVGWADFLPTLNTFRIDRHAAWAQLPTLPVSTNKMPEGHEYGVAALVAFCGSCSCQARHEVP